VRAAAIPGRLKGEMMEFNEAVPIGLRGCAPNLSSLSVCQFGSASVAKRPPES
jgi:hypothetical protein